MRKETRESVDFVYLDSGVGGLPYLQFLKDSRENITSIYVADTKNFPYGTKSRAEVIECATGCVRLIMRRFLPQVIVLACNTMSVAALDSLRETFKETKFIGTVPAVKLASSLTKTHKIGLLGTERTISDPYTKHLIESYTGDSVVISRADTKLISFIEHSFFSASESERTEAVRESVDFFASNDCDVIVLSCTHFLNMTKYFTEYIEKTYSGKLKILDSRAGVTRQALKVFDEIMKENASASRAETSQPTRLFISGESGSGPQTSKISSESLAMYKSFCLRNNITFAGIID